MDVLQSGMLQQYLGRSHTQRTTAPWFAPFLTAQWCDASAATPSNLATRRSGPEWKLAKRRHHCNHRRQNPSKSRHQLAHTHTEPPELQRLESTLPAAWQKKSGMPSDVLLKSLRPAGLEAATVVQMGSQLLKNGSQLC